MPPTGHDLDRMAAELKAAGWTAQTPSIWKSPSGQLFLGPAGAWRLMNGLRTVRSQTGAVMAEESHLPSPAPLVPDDTAWIDQIATAHVTAIAESHPHLAGIVNAERRDAATQGLARGRAETQREVELLAALKKAVETIRAFHDIGVYGRGAADDDAAWALYQASPEMQQINAAIAKAETS
jgi:hypothetical protein